MRLVIMTALVAGLALPQMADAEVLSSKSRAKLFRSQTSVLDNRAKQQYNNSVRLQPPSVITPSKWGNPGIKKVKYRGPYLAMAREAASRHGIPVDLFLRLVQQESGWNPKAKSHAGAMGLAQLMPGTARVLGVNPHDPYENLNGGARYLSEQYREFGTWRLALAAYNAGPEAVRKYNGVPPYKETQHYVKVIWGS